MKLSSKVSNFLEYLFQGGEVEIEGMTYVWLNNYVTWETETHQYIIDGLAVKGIAYQGKSSETKTTYIGQSGMSIDNLLKLVGKIDTEQWRKISMGLVLGGQ